MAGDPPDQHHFTSPGLESFRGLFEVYQCPGVPVGCSLGVGDDQTAGDLLTRDEPLCGDLDQPRPGTVFTRLRCWFWCRGGFRWWGAAWRPGRQQVGEAGAIGLVDL